MRIFRRDVCIPLVFESNVCLLTVNDASDTELQHIRDNLQLGEYIRRHYPEIVLEFEPVRRQERIECG